MNGFFGRTGAQVLKNIALLPDVLDVCPLGQKPLFRTTLRANFVPSSASLICGNSEDSKLTIGPSRFQTSRQLDWTTRTPIWQPWRGKRCRNNRLRSAFPPTTTWWTWWRPRERLASCIRLAGAVFDLSHRTCGGLSATRTGGETVDVWTWRLDLSVAVTWTSGSSSSTASWTEILAMWFSSASLYSWSPRSRMDRRRASSSSGCTSGERLRSRPRGRDFRRIKNWKQSKA